MQLYPSHRPFQSHPIYRHSTTMQWCCGYYWLPQGLELHHYRSYVRTHFAVLQFKILLRMITNMIHMISHTPSSYNIIKIVRNRLEQGPLTCPEHWTVVSQNLEHLTLFFSKPGTPDSADLFLHESYFLKLRQCTLTLKLAGKISQMKQSILNTFISTCIVPLCLYNQEKHFLKQITLKTLATAWQNHQKSHDKFLNDCFIWSVYMSTFSLRGPQNTCHVLQCAVIQGGSSLSLQLIREREVVSGMRVRRVFRDTQHTKLLWWTT